jgi:hypothetical protein
MRAAVLLGLLGLLAQDAKPPEKKEAKPPLPANFGQLLDPALEKRLGLNAEQRERLDQLREEFKEKCVEVHERTQAEAEKIRKGMEKPDRATQRKLGELQLRMLRDYQKLRAEYEPKLRALLSEEQKKKYDALLREQEKAPPPKKEAAKRPTG